HRRGRGHEDGARAARRPRRPHRQAHRQRGPASHARRAHRRAGGRLVCGSRLARPLLVERLRATHLPRCDRMIYQCPSYNSPPLHRDCKVLRVVVEYLPCSDRIPSVLRLLEVDEMSSRTSPKRAGALPAEATLLTTAAVPSTTAVVTAVTGA